MRESSVLARSLLMHATTDKLMTRAPASIAAWMAFAIVSKDPELSDSAESR